MTTNTAYEIEALIKAYFIVPYILICVIKKNEMPQRSINDEDKLNEDPPYPSLYMYKKNRCIHTAINKGHLNGLNWALTLFFRFIPVMA